VGIAPPAERLVYLNFNYLVILETLNELNLGRYIAGSSDVLPLNIFSSESFTRHDLLLATYFVGDHMERTLSGVQTSMYSVVAPRELLTVTTRYAASMVFYTDGSLIEGCAVQVVPAGIFTAELTVLFVTLRHIGEVIQPPEKCLISVKGLLSIEISYRTHLLVYECKDGVEVEIMWI
jgi:hypothetical protein